MNKLLMLILTASLSLSFHQPIKTNSSDEPIVLLFQGVMNSFMSIFCEWELGGTQVPQDIERYVQGILHEVGIPNAYKIKVKYADSVVTGGYASTNGYSIYLSEDIFSKINSLEELRFVIGHEGIHIKHQHIKKEGLVRLLSAFLFSASLHYAVTKNMWGYADWFMWLYEYDPVRVNCMFTLMIYLIVQSWVSKRFEREADLEAGRLLGNAQFGAEFFARMIQEKGDHWGFTHPKPSTRVAYLLALARTQHMQRYA